jgi:hypothetical protein
MEYPKTENLYARDPESHVCGPEYGFRMREIGLVSTWLVLEKVDGMNMRVVFEPGEDEPVKILGRTDRAQIPGDLRASIESWATFDALASTFLDLGETKSAPLCDVTVGPAKVILYGEGYGAGIQSGGHYRPDKGFILFDVVVDGTWLAWDNVVDVAAKLGIERVPVLARGVDLETAKTYVSTSHLTDGPVEGIIGRTDPYLFTGRGQRVAFKFKGRDLQTANKAAGA